MPTTNFILPFRPAFDSNGLPVAGAKLNFYLTGTLTRTPVYADSAMIDELPNPVVANSAGRFADIFMDGAVTYRVVLTDENDVTLDDSDPYSFGDVGTYVDLISTQSISGSKTFDNLTVTEQAYGVSWNGSSGVPTKNAIYDALSGGTAITVPDEAYGVSWNGSLQVPTKNAVYDKVNAVVTVLLAAANTWALAQTFTSGIVINSQTLDGLTAFGVSMAEATDAAAGRTALGMTALGSGLAIAADAAAARTLLELTAEATAAEYRANTADRTLTTDQTWAAADFVTLTQAATIAVDMSAGFNFTTTMTGNRTLGNPTNTKNGQSGVIEIVQDGTGSRTLAFASNWKFVGGTDPVLSTAAGTRDLLSYQVISSTVIFASLAKAIA